MTLCQKESSLQPSCRLAQKEGKWLAQKEGKWLAQKEGKWLAHKEDKSTKLPWWTVAVWVESWR